MNTQSETTRRDPLRRFTPTPLVADSQVMGRTVRLETNSPAVLQNARQLFKRYGENADGKPEFVWKIVTEGGTNLRPPWPKMTAFSDGGLRFLNIGQRNFVAVDLESREAVGFLSDDLAKDEPGIAAVFFARIFFMTAAALGLTPISAACVGTRDKGIILVGPPECGKTTVSYIAKRIRLEFHADMVTFLEVDRRRLRAWGEFWPALFRSEGAQFCPELLHLTRPLGHLGRTFLAMNKNSLHSSAPLSVQPIVSIFLEREVAQLPRLIPLSSRESSARFEESLAFQDDERFQSQQATAIRALTQLPAYRLVYGRNPAEAAVFFRSLLSVHDGLGATE